MIGLAVGDALGDALGAAIEFQPKPQFALLDDMRDGGPHHLKRGQWTDDTAMALALADSLLHDPALDANDLMTRFQDWYERGTYSCTGTCFDIGNTTRSALMRFKRDCSPLAGSTSASASGNGALMRLAPVAVCYWSSRAEMLRVAELQTRTTHGPPATRTASAIFAAMLADAIAGQGLPDILAGDAASRIDGGWRGLHRDRIQGSGYVAKSLQAAVWAVSRTTDFRSAILLAANLGDDADTTAAIAGQLAGAVYGLSGIPGDWLDALAWRERLEQTAQELFELGQQDTDSLDEQPATLGDAFAAPWMTGDWTLRERLTALAAFEPVISAPGFRAATFQPGRPDGDMMVLGGYVYGRQTMRFTRMTYDYGWVRIVDWSAWSDTPRGKALLEDRGALATANEDELAAILTTCIRADRFCDGALDTTFENGLILRVVIRARELLQALPFGGRRGRLGD
jgi:ADP-ribosylglycohydrolase